MWRSQPESFGFRHLPRDEGMGEKKTKGALWLNPRPSPHFLADDPEKGPVKASCEVVGVSGFSGLGCEQPKAGYS